MADRLVIIGGDAAGMSAASQARRRRGRDRLEIIVFERSSYVSYSACGEPYYVGGYVDELSELQVRTPEQFARAGIDARIRHEVTEIHPTDGKVNVRGLEDGGEELVGYDHLLYATGAAPLRPPIEGLDLEGVHMLRTLDDAEALRRAATAGVKRAVVVGGGYIGLEVAEAFHHLGIETTVVTMMPTVLERTFDPDMGALVTDRMRDIGIDVRTGIKVECLRGEKGRVREVGCAAEGFPAELVVLGLGSRPEVDIAAEAGIPLGPTGAVAVDERQRTGVDGVWAAGDCAEVRHRLTGRPANFHLGTVANKTGRVAGINLGGGNATFPGVLGTAITKVCELEIARTGLMEAEAEQAGFEVVTTTLSSTTTAGYWPEAAPMKVKAIAQRGSGRLLGAQIVGGKGAGKRVDVFATALWNDMTADEMSMMDLSYAPPFSGVWDPVLIAARKVAEAAAG